MPFAAGRPAVLRPFFAGLLAAGLAAPAAAADDKPYAPVPVEIGTAVAPSNALLIAAKLVRDAAEQRNAEGVFSMLADEVTVVRAGITVASTRSAEKKGPFKDAGEAFSTIGALFQEGDIPASGRTVDMGALYADSSMEVIVTAVDGADWGRDPLVKGGVCTYRGARWDRKAGEKADRGTGSRGAYVLAPTKAFKSADPGAKAVATLKPGVLYLQGFMDDLPEDWSAVRLPGGGVGAVPQADLKNPVPWGVCFLPDGKGSWLVSAFASALL